MDSSIAAMIAEMDNDPTPIYKGYSRKQLSDAFGAVRNPNDWKDAILVSLPGEAVMLAVAAIEFFTATVPVISLNIETMRYVVSSIGYRAGPAGDH